jgi:hypothetical protein
LGLLRSFEYVCGHDPDRPALIFMAFAAGTQRLADHYEQVVGFM